MRPSSFFLSYVGAESTILLTYSDWPTTHVSWTELTSWTMPGLYIVWSIRWATQKSLYGTMRLWGSTTGLVCSVVAAGAFATLIAFALIIIQSLIVVVIYIYLSPSIHLYVVIRYSMIRDILASLSRQICFASHYTTNDFASRWSFRAQYVVSFDQ